MNIKEVKYGTLSELMNKRVIYTNNKKLDGKIGYAVAFYKRVVECPIEHTTLFGIPTDIRKPMQVSLYAGADYYETEMERDERMSILPKITTHKGEKQYGEEIEKFEFTWTSNVKMAR